MIKLAVIKSGDKVYNGGKVMKDRFKRWKEMVRVWLADITPLLIEETYQKYYERLPLWRREKADRMRMPKGKAQSVGVWSLWSRVKEMYGLPGDAVYNLSHSGKYVLCAFSDRPQAKVGCDLEEDGEFREAVARRFFCPKEYEHIMGEKEADRAQLFCRYWVLKESFMKATRKGMAMELDSFEIGWEDRTPVLVKKPEEYTEKYIYQEYDGEDIAVKIAVCTTDPDIDRELHILVL